MSIAHAQKNVRISCTVIFFTVCSPVADHLIFSSFEIEHTAFAAKCRINFVLTDYPCFLQIIGIDILRNIIVDAVKQAKYSPIIFNFGNYWALPWRLRTDLLNKNVFTVVCLKILVWQIADQRRPWRKRLVLCYKTDRNNIPVFKNLFRMNIRLYFLFLRLLQK